MYTVQSITLHFPIFCDKNKSQDNKNKLFLVISDTFVFKIITIVKVA